MALGGSAARRYAEAMFELAPDDAARAAFRASLGHIAAATEAPQTRLLRDPGVSLARRREAAGVLAEGEPTEVRSLLTLLVESARVRLLPGIAAAFDELIDRHDGVAKARVTTAIALDEAQRRDVSERLSRATGKKIQATFDVDADLLGGARIQVGDRLADASVRAQLERLQTALSTGR